MLKSNLDPTSNMSQQQQQEKWKGMFGRLRHCRGPRKTR